MKTLNKYILSFALIASVSTFAQEAADVFPGLDFPSFFE